MLETIRSDSNTTIPDMVDKAKRRFGVEVPKMMAWRVRMTSKDIVLGDHKRQYQSLRYYLETVKATNPRFRCIVTIMDKIVNIHYIDKEAFMNVDIVDKYEEMFTFLESPTYEEVVTET
ncbi:hypothetical protein D1007_12090 [Hordeum vulgare]|nr:hypothetical protein D1007_12090 [Hordeum vulgare]